jgi:ABC-2 type transport system ATP-binding protein
MTQPTIHTEGLSKRFGRTVALNGVDLAVPQGAIYALVGANGAGKTTLIKLLMKILRPSAGRAQVLGIDVHRLAGQAFQRIGYVSENQELPEGMTVGGMLDYFRAFYPTWDRTLEQQLVRQFDLPLQRKLKHLSRGMRMKAAFASSLAYRPPLIVLDEPFTGLDPLVRDELIEGLIERAPETTIFLSSHDLAEIETFSSHVGYLEQGRLLFSEEMTVLAGRFREVTVTLAAPAPLPASLPPSCNRRRRIASSVSSTVAITSRVLRAKWRRDSPPRAIFASTLSLFAPFFWPSPKPNAPP